MDSSLFDIVFVIVTPPAVVLFVLYLTLNMENVIESVILVIL